MGRRGMTELLREKERAMRARPLLSLTILAIALVAAFAITGAATGDTTGANACAASLTNPQLSGSAFEIDVDANLKVDAANCIDWLASPANAFRTGVNAKNDKASGTGDDSFGQGTSENDVTPTIVSGSIPPNKSDLKAFGIYSEVGQSTTQNPSGKFLELFWSRVQNPSGTTNMDFELNQKFCDPSATPTNCSPNGVTPIRTDGDRLITYDLSKGGTVPTISIRTWSASNSTWGDPTVISGSGASDALGSVNTSTIPSTETGGATGGLTASLGSQDPYTFGEAALTFKALFSGQTTCGSFGSAYLKSRSSASFTAEIKDFVAPERVNISNCTTLTTSATASATIGSAIHDTATLSGATPNATGGITFELYGPFTGSDATQDTCVDSGTGANLVTTLGPISLGTQDANGNFVVGSGDYTPTAVGRYQWVASYPGDANNSSATTACKDSGEASVVSKKQPSISTSATASVTIGSAIHDTATLSNGTSDISGTITFKLYGPFTGSDATQDTCVDSGTGANLVTTLTNSTVNGNGNYGSGDYTPTAVGRYQWVASYGGDSKNLTATTACKDSGEASVVGTASSSMTTAQKLRPQDSATVSAGAGGTPTGSVTFKLFGPNNLTCNTAAGAAAPVYTETVTLDAQGKASTSNSSFDISAATSAQYHWLVTYPGDGTHDGTSSACTESFTLTIAN